MQQVLLNSKQIQIHVTIIIMVTKATWLTQNYPWPQSNFFSGLTACVHTVPSASPSVLIWVINFSHTFAMGSVTCTYILSHPEWFIRINIFTLWWYWCINSFFISETHSQQIQKVYHAVTGLIITFDVIFMVSNMITWFVQSQCWWFQMYLWSSVPYSVF